MGGFSRCALAREIGVSQPAVSKALRRGQLTVGADGVIWPHQPQLIQCSREASSGETDR
jgi:hypothetical protein